GDEPARPVVAIEARPVPADVGVQVPRIADDRDRSRARDGDVGARRPRARAGRGLPQHGIEIEPAGGRVGWVQRGGRHRRHLISEVDGFEPRGVDVPGGGWDARTGRSGDDDQGERRDERGARDDSGESHYWGYLTRDSRPWL